MRAVDDIVAAPVVLDHFWGALVRGKLCCARGANEEATRLGQGQDGECGALFFKRVRTSHGKSIARQT